MKTVYGFWSCVFFCIEYIYYAACRIRRDLVLCIDEGEDWFVDYSGHESRFMREYAVRSSS